MTPPEPEPPRIHRLPTGQEWEFFGPARPYDKMDIFKHRALGYIDYIEDGNSFGMQIKAIMKRHYEKVRKLNE
jgi:hypothetical protein